MIILDFVLVEKPALQPEKEGCQHLAHGSIFDPSDFMLSLILPGRFFQRLCLRDFKWNEPASSDIRKDLE